MYGWKDLADPPKERMDVMARRTIGAGRKFRPERPGMLAVFLAPKVDAAAGANCSRFSSGASRPDSADAA
jgi:hypothetical protein